MPQVLWPNRRNGGKLRAKNNKSGRIAVMRAVILVAALGLTAARVPEIPESGTGFDSSFDDALAQNAAIAGARTSAAVPPSKVVSTETLAAADTAPLAPPVVAAAVPPQPQPLPAPVSRAVTTQTETAEDILPMKRRPRCRQRRKTPVWPRWRRARTTRRPSNTAIRASRTKTIFRRFLPVNPLTATPPV